MAQARNTSSCQDTKADYEEVTLKEMLKSDDIPFSCHQNRFKLQIHGVLGKAENLNKMLLELLNTPSVLEFADFIIKCNEGDKIAIGDTIYMLLAVTCSNTSKITNIQNASLTIHLRVYKKDGNQSSYMTATASISNFLVQRSETLEDLMEVDIHIKNIERVSRMIVYYALLSISTVCENLDLVKKVLFPVQDHASGMNSIYALIPFNFSDDEKYKENTLTSVVHCVNDAIQDNLKLAECEEELCSIGVIPDSIKSLSKYFNGEIQTFLSPSDVHVVSSRPSNFKMYCCKGNIENAVLLFVYVEYRHLDGSFMDSFYLF